MTAVQKWARRNLFRSTGDSVTTVVVGSILLYLLYRFLRYVFVTGRWTIVESNLYLYLTGVWPDDQLWRLIVAILIMAAGGGLTVGYYARRRAQENEDAGTPQTTDWRNWLARVWPLVGLIVILLVATTTIGPLLLVLAAVVALVAGRLVGARLPRSAGRFLAWGLPLIVLALIWFLAQGHDWNSWGGLLLNLVLAAISITLCFPLGLLLALGRRSSFPIVRGISTAYIELFRGLPLIALLLMANVALGFFIPGDLAPGDVVRAIVVFVLFTAAYVAEIVRGGLQSVPRGQIEAGRALGLSPVSVTRRIVLPQALRNVIPALVGQFISLFKDTTLAGAAMGFIDLLRAAEASTQQREFLGQGLIVESLVFVSIVFWAGSYTMSKESQELETRLGVGT